MMTQDQLDLHDQKEFIDDLIAIGNQLLGYADHPLESLHPCRANFGRGNLCTCGLDATVAAWRRLLVGWEPPIADTEDDQ